MAVACHRYTVMMAPFTSTVATQTRSRSRTRRSGCSSAVTRPMWATPSARRARVGGVALAGVPPGTVTMLTG